MKFIKKPSIYNAIQWTCNNKKEIETYLNFYQVPFKWKILNEKVEYLEIFIKQKNKKVFPGCWIVESDIESRNLHNDPLSKYKTSDLNTFSNYEFEKIFLNYQEYLNKKEKYVKRIQPV
jgi:hypothetical protein